MKATWVCKACTRQLLAAQRRHYTVSLSPDAAYRDYQAAVAALNTLQSNFSAVEAIRKQGPGWNKRAIPEMIEWIRRIGYERHDFDRMNPVHIAGTKGKGSTSTFISSILAQYLPTQRSIHAERLPSPVGLYTSPHLRFVRERIQVDDKPISEDLFAECFWEVWDRLEATKPAADLQEHRSIDGKPVYFHYLTLMAFHCFLQQSVGTAVVECGIGGEYDTTNVLLHPSVTGIASLGIDHEALLGDTIESIAWHKAGIFKPNVPAFSVPQPEGAERVLRERADERNAPLHFVPIHSALEGQHIKLGLQGEFQKINASLAIAVAAQHLQKMGYSGLPDPSDPAQALPQEFVNGLEAAHLGGRCEKRVDLVSPGVTWHIDGGHTQASIEVAATWFAQVTDDSKANRILIFNQQTRDASSLARRLFDTLASALDDKSPFSHVIFCPNVTSSRAGYKADLVSINTNKHDIQSLKVQMDLAATWDALDQAATVHVVSSIEEAVVRARELSQGQAGDVLVTGSLHLVGGLIDVLESEKEVAA